MGRLKYRAVLPKDRSPETSGSLPPWESSKSRPRVHSDAIKLDAFSPDSDCRRMLKARCKASGAWDSWIFAQEVQELGAEGMSLLLNFLCA